MYLIRRKNEIGIIKKEEKFKMSEIEMNLLINEIINRKEFNNNGKEEEIEKIVLYELMIGTWMDM